MWMRLPGTPELSAAYSWIKADRGPELIWTAFSYSMSPFLVAGFFLLFI